MPSGIFSCGSAYGFYVVICWQVMCHNGVAYSSVSCIIKFMGNFFGLVFHFGFCFHSVGLDLLGFSFDFLA